MEGFILNFIRDRQEPFRISKMERGPIKTKEICPSNPKKINRSPSMNSCVFSLKINGGILVYFFTRLMEELLFILLRIDGRIPAYSQKDCWRDASQFLIKLMEGLFPIICQTDGGIPVYSLWVSWTDCVQLSEN